MSNPKKHNRKILSSKNDFAISKNKHWLYAGTASALLLAGLSLSVKASADSTVASNAVTATTSSADPSSSATSAIYSTASSASPAVDPAVSSAIDLTSPSVVSPDSSTSSDISSATLSDSSSASSTFSVANTISASGTIGTCPWSMTATLDSNSSTNPYMYSVQSLVIGAGTLPDSFSVASLVAGANFDYSGAQRNTDYIVNYQHINQLSLTGPIIAGVSLANAFSNLYTLTSITGLSNLDTHATTDMSHMFEEDQYLVSVDLSHFNTSQVTDMSHMFDNVDTLNNLNLSTFDTSNVTNMSYMFQGLSLNSLNLSNFNTAKVSDMSYMFNSDLSLTALDLSSFTISSTTNTTGMLQFLTLLDTLTLGAGIATLNNSGLSTRSNPNLDGNWVSSSSIVYSADNLTNNWSPNMAGTYTAEKVPWPSYSVVAALTPVWDPTISITDCFNYALSRNGMSANASIVSIVVTDSAHAQLTYNYSGSQYTMDLTLKTLSGADVSVPSILSTPGTTEYAWKTNGGATLIGYFTLDVL